MSLVKNKFTKIEIGLRRTNQIKLNKGLAQGAPLSPWIFSLVVHHLIREYNERSIKET